MANPVHLEIFSQGVLTWNHWRVDRPEVQPNLTRVELGDANFRGVDFRNVNLGGANLSEAFLGEANLSGADLSRLLGVSRQLGPMILRGEREITAAHARILGKRFALSPGAFIE